MIETIGKRGRIRAVAIERQASRRLPERVPTCAIGVLAFGGRTHCVTQLVGQLPKPKLESRLLLGLAEGVGEWRCPTATRAEHKSEDGNRR